MYGEYTDNAMVVRPPPRGDAARVNHQAPGRLQFSALFGVGGMAGGVAYGRCCARRGGEPGAGPPGPRRSSTMNSSGMRIAVPTLVPIAVATKLIS